MFVTKRKGHIEEVQFDKISNRIKMLVSEPTYLSNINVQSLTQTVIQGIFNEIKTSEIDEYTANVSASLSITHRNYSILAGRIVVNNHHKNTLTSFRDKMNLLYLRKDAHGNVCPVINDKFHKYVKKNQKEIEKYIDYNRDYELDFFSFKTLEKSYLLRLDDTIIERPQDLFMRVAIFIHMDIKDWKSPLILDRVFETYDLLSKKYFTHATPTLFNAGLVRPQLLSCFLLGTEDSLEGIMKTLTDCANISKWSGGVGFHFSNWRSKGALIRGTNGSSNGTIPFLKLFNDTARAFNQGGRRLGSFAAYIEPHHPDINNFLNLKRNHGDENLRARDLFLSLWVSDLFMERVKNNLDWSVFDPDECPGLTDVFGEAYRELYEKYEKEGMARQTYKARDIWKNVFTSQKESGTPYICFKDTVNNANNQKNVGVIKSSNLCSEIMEYSSSTEYACCCLSSICLPSFVEDAGEDPDHEFPKEPFFNYEKFVHTIGVAVRNLNQVIDKNYYPVPETKKSNMKHRPLGIGVQGLADVFFKFKYTFDSPEAKELNKKIFETMYFAALSASNEQSKEIYETYSRDFQDKDSIVINKTTYESLPTTIGAYESFQGSPISQGIFHWEMHGLSPTDLLCNLDWDSLRESIKTFGVRNSLLIALMPTASTSQIMGNTEAFEMLTSNIFKRQTLAGEFIVVNKFLINDLEKIGMWSKDVENYLKLNNGSIQSIENIPSEIKYRYRTVWEISQKTFIDLAADRQAFVDQSQSLNLFVEDLSFSKFNSMHFYSWERKLKTGCYYLRSRPAIMAQKFTVELEENLDKNIPVCSGDACTMCSS